MLGKGKERDAMLLFPLASILAHVPGYGGDCEFSCCHLPHPTRPDVSQAVYLKGTAGIEIDLDDIKDFIDEKKDIEFSLVFKEEYEVTSFQIFVGCGGCASHRTPDHYHGWDPINSTTNLLPVPYTYQKGHLEAFTQHAYFPLLPKGTSRMFNAGQLSECESDHFSIRVVTFDNATDDMTYSIAIGCESGPDCEQFTYMELFLFPLYVYRSHGSYWNQAGFTLPLIAAVVGVLYLLGLYWFADRSWLFLYEPVSMMQPQRIVELIARTKPGYNPRFSEIPCVSWRPSIRATIYAIVVYALVVDIFESTVHVFISLYHLNQSSQPYEGGGVTMWLILVLGIGKILPLVLVSLSWRVHRAVPEFCWRTTDFKYVCDRWRGFGSYSPFWAHGAWSIAEIMVLGVLGLIWLGAGYWVLPFGMLIAGGFRLGILLVNPDRYQRGVQFVYPSYDTRWSRGMGGICDDATKQMLVDAYNESVEGEPYASDRKPLINRDDDVPPPAYTSAYGNTSATRPLSLAEVVQLGRR